MHAYLLYRPRPAGRQCWGALAGLRLCAVGSRASVRPHMHALRFWASVTALCTCGTTGWWAACAENVFPVTSFGAKGDGRTDDYAAVLKAAAAAKAAGGGTLLFPVIPKQAELLAGRGSGPCSPTPCPGKPGVTFCSSNSSSGQCSDPMPHAPCPPCFNPTAGMKTGYVTGAFNISSNTHVEISKGVHLLGAQNSSQWPLLTVAKVWPGFGYARDGEFGGESGRLMHQSLIFTWGTTNISVGGGGTIDCRGGYFQACGGNLTKAPCSGHARPECVFFSNATDVVFEDVTVLNSPDWTLHFSSVDHLRVRRVNVTQPGIVDPNHSKAWRHTPTRSGGNRDGIDIDSCQDVVVEDSYFASGDDTLCVKSGLDWFGRRYHRPSRDIIFRNITTGGGYGVTIGSETSGDVINVTFENINVNHQTAGIHIKSPPGRGGIITNITYRNITMNNVRQCILVGVGGNGCNKTALPIASNILFENVRCNEGSTSSYDMQGANRSFPIENMRFVNVTMATGVKKEANCHAIQCTCDALTSPCPSCCKKEPSVGYSK